MYQDRARIEEVKLLCCLSSPPKRVDGRIAPGGVDLQGMCCVRKPGTIEKSVIISSFTNGVAAYKVTSNSLDWKVKGKLSDMKKEMQASGITTDGSGRVFVHDMRNACVQVFTLSGNYSGVLLRERERGLGTICRISWYNDISSLIVAHWEGYNDYISLSTIKV